MSIYETRGLLFAFRAVNNAPLIMLFFVRSCQSYTANYAPMTEDRPWQGSTLLTFGLPIIHRPWDRLRSTSFDDCSSSFIAADHAPPIIYWGLYDIPWWGLTLLDARTMGQSSTRLDKCLLSLGAINPALAFVHCRGLTTELNSIYRLGNAALRSKMLTMHGPWDELDEFVIQAESSWV